MDLARRIEHHIDEGDREIVASHEVHRSGDEREVIARDVSLEIERALRQLEMCQKRVTSGVGLGPAESDGPEDRGRDQRVENWRAGRAGHEDAVDGAGAQVSRRRIAAGLEGNQLDLLENPVVAQQLPGHRSRHASLRPGCDPESTQISHGR